MIRLFLLLILVASSVFSVPVSSRDDLDSWGIKNESSDLANRTMHLKKLAMEIQNLRGVNVTATKTEVSYLLIMFICFERI